MTIAAALLALTTGLLLAMAPAGAGSRNAIIGRRAALFFSAIMMAGAVLAAIGTAISNGGDF